MGIWPFGKKKQVLRAVQPAKKKKPRRTKAEILRDQERERRQKLEAEKAEALAKVEMKRIEMQLKRLERGEDAEEPIDIDRAIRKIKALGFDVIPKASKFTDNDNAWSLFRDFVNSPMAASVGVGLVQALAGQMQAGQDAEPKPSSLPAGAQAGQVQAGSEPKQSIPSAASNTGTSGEVSPESFFLISQLQNLDPMDAASWLLAQSQARPFVEMLVKSTDAELPALLSQLAQTVPQLTNFVAWLRDRPKWLVDTVKELRRLAEQGSRPMGL